MRRQVCFIATVLLLTAARVHPQTANEPNQGLKLRYEKAAVPEEISLWDLSWWGRQGWTYFVQHSPDLVNWEYLPTIDLGDAAPVGYQWPDEGSPRGFLRLQIWQWGVNDPFNDDFDEDKVSNYEEVYLYGTDPLVKFDTDQDGMPDDWETKYFGSATAGAPNAHDDGDALTNLEEYDLGTNPKATDTDGDGLSDSDEFSQHGTDPLLADSDGDGVNDGAEVAAGTFPHFADSDGDGATDGAEAAANTDALDDQTYPPVWRSYERGLVYMFYDYNGTYSQPDEGDLRIYHSGNYNGTTQNLSSPIDLTALADDLPAFPAAPNANTFPGWGSAGVDAWAGGPPDGTICYHAEVWQQRIWLCVQPAAAVDIVRTVPILVDRSINDVKQPPEVRMQTVTILAGQTHSEPIDLVPEPTVNPPADVLWHEEQADERKFDVEILIPDMEKASDGTEHFRFDGKERKLTAAKQLAIATLENSFDELKSSKPLKQDAANEKDWISEDPDSFYIRVSEPALSGTGPLKARVWTDSEGTDYDDDARSSANSELVELDENGTTGVFTSDSMLLMSNAEDDFEPVGSVSDNQLNDRTRLIALGGSLKVEFLPAGQSPTYKPSAEVQVPVERTVKFKVWVAKVNNEDVISEGIVDSDYRLMKEAFAQVGIAVVRDQTIVKFEHTHAGIHLDPSGFDIDHAIFGDPERYALFNWIDTHSQRPADTISVVYVNYTTTQSLGGDNGPPGISYIDKLYSPAKYANHIIISASKRKLFTAPHELLHILMDAEHNDYPKEKNHKRMLFYAPDLGDFTDVPGIEGRKRISKRSLGNQKRALFASPYAQ